MIPTCFEVRNPEEQYLEILEYALLNGAEKGDNQGIGNVAVFDATMRWEPAKHFPLFTTKRVPFKALTVELLWFLRGDTNVDFLHKHGVTIWDEWATPEMCAMYGRSPGELGPIYGEQFRRWPAADGRKIDQIQNLINELRSNPDSRRLIVSAWNPADVDKVFIAWCHGIIKFAVLNGVLHIAIFQRSADMFLGVPFNMASYSLLLFMVAQVVGLKPGQVVHHLIDCHIYKNHFEQVKLQLSRKSEIRTLPTVTLNPEIKDIFGFEYPRDFTVNGYNPMPSISAPIGI